MLKMNLQLFGGRGANYIPSNRRTLNPGNRNYGIGLGERIGSVKESLGTKGEPMSASRAVSGANPNWNGNYDSYSANCQRCVVAYELRRRGYDVEARATFAGDDKPTIAYRDRKDAYHGRWMGAFKGAKTLNVGVPGNSKASEEKVIANIEKQMKKYGNGSRAVVQTFWRGGGGHVFNIENQNGRIVFYEAQLGAKSSSRAIKDVKATIARTSTGSVNLIRTDNLKVSGRVNQFVKQANGKGENNSSNAKADRRRKIQEKTKKYKK